MDHHTGGEIDGDRCNGADGYTVGDAKLGGYDPLRRKRAYPNTGPAGTTGTVVRADRTAGDPGVGCRVAVPVGEDGW